MVTYRECLILHNLQLRRRKLDKVSNLAKSAFYSSLNFNQRSLMFLDTALKGMKRNKLEHLKLSRLRKQLLLLHIFFVTKFWSQFAVKYPAYGACNTCPTIIISFLKSRKMFLFFRLMFCDGRQDIILDGSSMWCFYRLLISDGPFHRKMSLSTTC